MRRIVKSREATVALVAVTVGLLVAVSVGWVDWKMGELASVLAILLWAVNL